MERTKQQITEVKMVSDDRLVWIERLAALMDNRFRIPGTNIRFGLDFIIGLFPYLGDIATFGISGLLLLMMARYGASGMVVVKMLGNILLDTVVGLVPFIGDLFDLKFKSNTRNLRLLKEHYQEGKHEGSAWGVVFLILSVLLGLLIFVIWVSWKVMAWFWGMMF
ncbi:MAG: DUF4112 domain-containing protein [Saprospiraceae bacterium]|nr:DUF4112 domain-containing protein [Saprospiraceae bacterium]